MSNSIKLKQKHKLYVQVPTSEHVAHIVGKGGSKIKKLCDATNTYIKSPIRGEQPIFIIFGQFKGAISAKIEIEQASNYFTDVIKSRSNFCSPGEVSVLIEVPQNHIGLVIGYCGCVIKNIKKETKTRINTLKYVKEFTVFEIIGFEVFKS